MTGTGVDPVVVDPTAVADSATVDRYSTADTINVLANDDNPSGEPVTITEVTQPSHGTVTIAAGGQSVDYVTFTYTLNGDPNATVSVKVVAPDDAPTITGITRKRGGATAVPRRSGRPIRCH